MADLSNAEALKVRQQKEWGEILTGIETKNKYNVTDHRGNPIFEAEEESGGFLTILTRLFLTYLRPFTISLFSRKGSELFVLKRPFRFFFHELDICRPNGMVLGKIIRRFALLRRIYVAGSVTIV